MKNKELEPKKEEKWQFVMLWSKDAIKILNLLLSRKDIAFDEFAVFNDNPYERKSFFGKIKRFFKSLK